MMKLIENSLIKVDLEKCTLCEACVNDCVVKLFNIESELLQITEDFEERCILCGHCVAICAVNVITLKTNEENYTIETSNIREVPDFQEFNNLVLKRRSIRQFKDIPIPRESIEKILDLARFAPTGGNSENIYYTIIQEKAIVKKISDIITSKVQRFVKTLEDPKGREKIKSSMPEEEFQLVIENLPRTKYILTNFIEKGIDFWCWNGKIIYIHGDSSIVGVGTNSAIAATHIMLAAETLGLGTCSLGYLTYYTNQSDTIKEIIGLPENHEVGYSLAIGYPKVKYKRIPSRKPLQAHWL
jgi:nitroreductase/NAD-dependent dihydropyrimidine dehydrogenase PreA subunit